MVAVQLSSFVININPLNKLFLIQQYGIRVAFLLSRLKFGLLKLPPENHRYRHSGQNLLRTLKWHNQVRWQYQVKGNKKHIVFSHPLFSLKMLIQEKQRPMSESELDTTWDASCMVA